MLLLTITLMGCATVMRDSSQIIPIQANIDNVDIEITNSDGAVVYTGKTPTTVWLKTAKKGYFSPENII